MRKKNDAGAINCSGETLSGQFFFLLLPQIPLPEVGHDKVGLNESTYCWVSACVFLSALLYNRIPDSTMSVIRRSRTASWAVLDHRYCLDGCDLFIFVKISPVCVLSIRELGGPSDKKYALEPNELELGKVNFFQL